MSNSEANALAQSQSNPNLTPTTQSFSFEPIPMGAPDAILVSSMQDITIGVQTECTPCSYHRNWDGIILLNLFPFIGFFLD